MLDKAVIRLKYKEGGSMCKKILFIMLMTTGILVAQETPEKPAEAPAEIPGVKPLKGPFGGGIGLLAGTYYMPGLSDLDKKLSGTWKTILTGAGKLPSNLFISGVRAYVYITQNFRLGALSMNGITRAGNVSEIDTYHYSCEFSISNWAFLMEFSPIKFTGRELTVSIGVGGGTATLRLLKILRLPSWDEICRGDEKAWGEGFASELDADFLNFRGGLEFLFPITAWFKLGFALNISYAKIPFGGWYLHSKEHRIANSPSVSLFGVTFEITPRFDNRPRW